VAKGKSKQKIADIKAERDVILGDQITQGYGVEQVQRLLEQIRTEFQAKPYDGSSPYVGLNSFEEQDDLFGPRLVVELLSVARQALFITGPSGQENHPRAGLIPALNRKDMAVNVVVYISDAGRIT
jgi:hypothetical protein